MKLAEALALRADLQTRLAQLASRATTNARHQEGEAPAEDPNALLAESDRVGDELATLIERINAQNLRTEVDAGVSMTAALARRDLLRQRHRLRTELADTASRPLDRFRFRQVVHRDIRLGLDLGLDRGRFRRHRRQPVDRDADDAALGAVHDVGVSRAGVDRATRT